jgi:hypothetical protein
MFTGINRMIVGLVILVVFTMAGIAVGAALMMKKAHQWENNYAIAHDSIIRQMVNGIETAQAGVKVMDKADVKKYMADEWQLFAKDLKLKGISQIASVTAETTHTFTTTLKDSTINDTLHVRAFDYSNRFLQFKGYEHNNTLTASYRYTMGLKLAISKQRRDGFVNKILFRPLTRDLQVNAVPEDSCMKITSLSTTIIR